jgi:hypothetical protein
MAEVWATFAAARPQQQHPFLFLPAEFEVRLGDSWRLSPELSGLENADETAVCPMLTLQSTIGLGVGVDSTCCQVEQQM